MGRRSEKRAVVQLTLGIGSVVRLNGQLKNLTVELVNADGSVEVVNVTGGFVRSSLKPGTFHQVPPEWINGEFDDDDHDHDDDDD